MTNEEILEKAIQKALDASWDMYDHDKCNWEIVNHPYATERDHYFVRVLTSDIFIDASYIIFDHDFAKALWGEEKKHSRDQFFDIIDKEGWKHYLQQMVIAEDPIKYLGEHLDG